MDLTKALRIPGPARIAFVGAGGKTTALFQLARALQPPVVVTCSTHLGAWQADLADRPLTISRPEEVERSAGQIEGVTLFTGPLGDEDRLQGLEIGTLDAIHDLASRLGFPVLIEADGSRQRPLKAPGEHEPVIPGWVSLAVVVAGLSALGQPLGESSVHRPDRFSRLTGMQPGEPVTAESIVQMLVHPEGGLKNIPAGARRVVLLNQVDQPDRMAAGLRIAKMSMPAFNSVILSSLSEQKIWRVVEPVAGVILAGGESRRLGQPKMLLEWRGKPLIRHAAEAALAAGLDPVVVVTGAVAEPIHQALAGLPVQFVHNSEWQHGQSTSVKSGMRALPAKTGGALFLLADQPFVTTDLVEKLLESYHSALSPVTAPRVAGRRANPVLFDCDTFPDLLELSGDTGGRGILDRYPVTYVDWDDTSLLLDVDTPEDYKQLRAME